MALIKRRPKIQVHAPRVVAPGRPFVARVVLTCREAIPVDHVDVELRGALVRYTDGQDGRSEHPAVFSRQRARVREAGELGPGEHAWSVHFRLPADAPPGYRGASYRIAYTYHVRVGRPWWPDTRAEFVALVESPPGEASSPASTRVFVAGPAQGTAPRFELSLGTTVVAAGESLRGAIALANTASHDYRDATLTLVALEGTSGLLGRDSHRRRVCCWTLQTAGLGDGEPLRFSLQIPEGVVAGFERDPVSLSWYLHAKVDVAWSRDPEAWIPLTIVGRRALVDAEERAPLAVGTERVEALWRAVAAACGLLWEPGLIHGRVGASGLRITREHADRRGLVVVARLETPDLGLGLDLAAGTSRLVGRDMSQIAWLEEHVSEHLNRRPPSAAGDRGLVFEDQGDTAASLRRFLDEVLAAARALEAARELIPAPAAMAAMVPAWERAAGRIDGRLHRAAMAIEGSLDGVPVAVRTDWDSRGHPRRTVFELRPSVPIDAQHHFAWRVEDGAPPASELPLAHLYPGARALDVARDAVRVFLAAPLLDPLDERDRLAALAVVGHHLEGRRGLYR